MFRSSEIWYTTGCTVHQECSSFWYRETSPTFVIYLFEISSSLISADTFQEKSDPGRKTEVNTTLRKRDLNKPFVEKKLTDLANTFLYMLQTNGSSTLKVLILKSNPFDILELILLIFAESLWPSFNWVDKRNGSFLISFRQTLHRRYLKICVTKRRKAHLHLLK